jgi:hypothetical protein
MQHIDDVRQFSGPVSAHVFKVPLSSGKTMGVYMFGDYHFSYDNRCPRCSASKGCYGIVDFIEQVGKDSLANGKSLDVFLELPYVSGDKSLREQSMTWIDPYFSQNATVGAKVSNAVGRILGRKETPYIGMLSKLYRTFGNKTYNHRRKDNAVRFHYTDTRIEANAARLIFPPMAKDPGQNERVIRWLSTLHQLIDSSDKFCDLLKAFLTSTDFVGDVQKLYGKSVIVTEAALSSAPPQSLSAASSSSSSSPASPGTTKKMHKIAKQFHGLPPAMQDTVGRYIRDRLAYVKTFLDEVIDYESGVRMFKGLTMGGTVSTAHEIATARGFLYEKIQTYIKMAYWGIALVGCMVLMDVYLICRMLRYLLRPDAPDGSCAIAYAGDAHISHYVDFFVRYLNLRPVYCSPIAAGGDDDGNDDDDGDANDKVERGQTAAVRCVTLDGSGTCDPKVLENMLRVRVYPKPATTTAETRRGNVGLSNSTTANSKDTTHITSQVAHILSSKSKARMVAMRAMGYASSATTKAVQRNNNKSLQLQQLQHSTSSKVRTPPTSKRQRRATERRGTKQVAM